jgi:hypothetical protein
MIPASLQCLLNICKKQPDHQDKPPASKNTHKNQKAPGDRNTQSTTIRNNGIFCTGAVVGDAGYGGGGGCGGGSVGSVSNGGGGCGGCGGD